MNGYASARYVYRTAGVSDEHVTDQDLFGELRIDMTMPKDRKYEFHFFGTGRTDLSDNRDLTTFYPLEDIGDTYRSATHGYLYEAHFDLNNVLPHINQVRIGRQSGARDEQIFFDGLAGDISIFSRLSVALYGGAAVHFFEPGNHWGDDSLAGAGLDYSPFSSTRISLDYLSVEDKQGSPPVDVHDRMVSLKLWQSLGTFLKTSFKYRYLNNDPRDLAVRAATSFPEAAIELNVNYFRQFSTENILSTDLSLFNAVLGQSAPYESYDVKLRKLFGRHFAADLGYFKRSLLDENQAGPFDRDYSRSFLLLELIDIPKDGLSLTLTGEQWDASGREYNSAGVDAGYAFRNKKNARINLGTYYSLYKYDYYIEPGVREKVRTYYISGRYPFGKSLSMNASYDYEVSIENYQTVKLGMRYDF